ncbi:DUF167 domain-containing protein [Candidatus Saccharibacteria bacterium]|nr:DUF167 domain-containing protein [Candidatus Saccharibacteria bacterium]
MIIDVLVKPGSKKGPLVEVVSSSDGVHDDMDGFCDLTRERNGHPQERLVVYVREKAHDGEANAGVTRLLADYFDVAKSCVILKGGGKSRQKTFEIIGK